MMGCSSLNGKAGPHGSTNSQDMEWKVLIARARSGAEQPRRRNKNWGNQRAVVVQQGTRLKEQEMDARKICGSRPGKNKGAKSMTPDQIVWSFSLMLRMIIQGWTR